MTRSKPKSSTTLAIAILATSLLAAPALAAGKHGKGHGHAAAADIGAPGKPEAVTRTIEVTMFDNYYEPENLTVKEGETVRFIVRNKGEFVHEFNIATPEMHLAHAPEMEMMVEHGVLEPDRINWDAAKKMQATMGHGMHDEANSLLLEPGKSGEIVWRMPKHATLQFACNVPGHYGAGMHGDLSLTH